MERRVFIAILLSAVVMYAYQALVPPPPPPAVAPPTPVEGSSPAVPSPAAEAPPAPDSTEPGVAATTTEAAEREIVVQTATTEVALSNRGGRVTHWRIKSYFDEHGAPVDLVPSGLPAREPLPFSLQVEDGAISRRLNEGLYRVSGDAGGKLDAREAPATLTFEYADSSGLTARKTFVFDPKQYIVDFSAAVSTGGKDLIPTVAWGPGLGDGGATAGGGSFFTGNYVQPPQGILNRAGRVERIARASVAEQPRHDGDFKFAGVDDHYFMAAALNTGPAQVSYRAVDIPTASGAQRQLLAQSLTLSRQPSGVRFFVGPKQSDLLQSIDQELVRAIDYGMFAWLVLPLLSALKWLYASLGNYGWAIVVLTIVINLLLAPLRHKSVVAMRKMQEIQPQLKAIQDRYANLKVTDPARQKMNSEIMELYKSKGANPASGCLPMLATMPVLLAFYSLLSMSIELRGAPFVGWIHDLSARDPYYVLPALMGVTMFWQQKITPSSADPVQQRVMMIMPLMFTGIMASSPSGAVLYWFIGQAWAIGQQYFTNWLIGPPTPVAVRPPAERRLKNVGAGRTTAADKRP
jgi:YidC/Oxa1 family membrane protein insertase